MSMSAAHNHKRHTKPCLYFQQSRCPLSTDGCDFLHIIDSSSTPPTSPLNDTFDSKKVYRTKACRYYVNGSCRHGVWCRFKHSADANAFDEIDMPDIRDVDPGLKWSTRIQSHPKYKTRPCREYLMGQCHFGEACAFLHSPPTPSTPLSPEIMFSNMSPAYSPLGIPNSPSPLTFPSPVEWPSSARASAERIAPTISPIYTPIPSSAYFLPLPKMGTGGPRRASAPSTFQPLTLELPLYGDIVSSILSPTSELSSSPTDTADAPATPNDDSYPYTPPSVENTFVGKVHERRRPVSHLAIPFLEEPLSSPPPMSGTMYIAPPPSPLGIVPLPYLPAPSTPGPHAYAYTYPTSYPTSGVPPTPSRRRSLANPAVSQQKSLYFRTKPCKFWDSEGECPKGDKCTFIHSPRPIAGRADKDDDEIDEPEHIPISPVPVVEVKSRLAESPDSPAHDSQPVTWRVVGGGVLMGGQRKVCPAYLSGYCSLGTDCALAHPSDDDQELAHIFTPSYNRLEEITFSNPFRARQSSVDSNSSLSSNSPPPSLSPTHGNETDTSSDDESSGHSYSPKLTPAKGLKLSISVPSPPNCLPVVVNECDEDGDDAASEFDWAEDVETQPVRSDDIIMKCGDKVIRLTKAWSTPSSPTFEYCDSSSYFFSAESP